VTAKMLWYEIALVLIGLGTIALVSHLFTQAGGVLLGVGLSMIAVPLVWGYARFFWRLGATIGTEVRVATTPVPSPAQIFFQLQAEWGRPPTVQEVAVVQTMLSNRRNEALISVGIALGAIYLIDRSAG